MRGLVYLTTISLLIVLCISNKCDVYKLYDNHAYDCRYANNVQLQLWGYEHSCLYVWRDEKFEYSCCGIGDPGAGERKYPDQTYCEYRSNMLDPVLHTYTYLINGTGLAGGRDVLVCCNDDRGVAIFLDIVIGIMTIALAALLLLGCGTLLAAAINAKYKSKETPGGEYIPLETKV